MKRPHFQAWVLTTLLCVALPALGQDRPVVGTSLEFSQLTLDYSYPAPAASGGVGDWKKEEVTLLLTSSIYFEYYYVQAALGYSRNISDLMYYGVVDDAAPLPPPVALSNNYLSGMVTLCYPFHFDRFGVTVNAGIQYLYLLESRVDDDPASAEYLADNRDLFLTSKLSFEYSLDGPWIIGLYGTYNYGLTSIPSIHPDSDYYLWLGSIGLSAAYRF